MYNVDVARFHRSIALVASALIAACSHASQAPNFSLLDDRGQSWTLAQQRGKAIALTFGFTHCADTCPMTLAKLVRLRSELGAQADALAVVLVTVDPERDTPAVLHRYLAHFGASPGGIVGLTGSASEIDAVEHAYHVWSQRIPGKRGGTYDEAHSAVIYFIDARGRIASIHDDDDSQAALAAAIRAMAG